MNFANNGAAALIRHGAEQRALFSRLAATEDGKALYGLLLREWERMAVSLGASQNNDLLRQSVGQAEGVRWVLEMFDEARGAQTGNAIPAVPCVSASKKNVPATL